jgi:hypothetical protein
MKHLKAFLRSITRVLTHPYRVLVYWDGLTACHRACSPADALAWASQYPADAIVIVRTRFNRIIAGRY